MLDAIFYIADWVSSGIYDFVVELFAWGLIKMEKAYWFMKLETLKFAWDIAKEILDDLNITAAINQAWGRLDSETLAWFSFFKIPEALNTLITAVVTRFVLARIGW